MQEGKIMSKQDFLQGGLYAKEQYEGLLVSSDSQHGGYSIGVQLDENTVLVVDHSQDSHIRERIQNWAPQIADIQRRYNTHNDSENHSR